MKLKRSERSYEQRRADQTIGLNPWLPNEFAFTRDMSAIAIPCVGEKFDRCIVRITTASAAHPIWHWDGDLDDPTITPSIGCDKRCGWHGTIIKGELSPAPGADKEGKS